MPKEQRIRQMKLARNPIVVFVVFLATFSLLLYVGSARTDSLVSALLWGLVITMSIVAVVRAVWHGRGPYTQDATLPDRIRRWVLDEPDDDGSP